VIFFRESLFFFVKLSIPLGAFETNCIGILKGL